MEGDLILLLLLLPFMIFIFGFMIVEMIMIRSIPKRPLKEDLTKDEWRMT